MTNDEGEEGLARGGGVCISRCSVFGRLGLMNAALACGWHSLMLVVRQAGLIGGFRRHCDADGRFADGGARRQHCLE